MSTSNFDILSSGWPDVDQVKIVRGASLGELDAFFATLQHRALRGEL